MSDDLIEKLYDRRVCSPAQNSCRNDWLLNQCRDRIEEMEAKLATCEKYRDAYAECDRITTQAVRDLEAKLAKCEAQLGKAVDALMAFNSFDDLPMPILLALAELKGGKDE